MTYVEPRGAGHSQGVEIGDYLVRQDGILIPRGLSDSAFVSQLVALGRPVELGFERRSEMTTTVIPHRVEASASSDESLDSSESSDEEIRSTPRGLVPVVETDQISQNVNTGLVELTEIQR